MYLSLLLKKYLILIKNLPGRTDFYSSLFLADIFKLLFFFFAHSKQFYNLFPIIPFIKCLGVSSAVYFFLLILALVALFLCVFLYIIL